jgi:hypothetical protein
MTEQKDMGYRTSPPWQEGEEEEVRNRIWAEVAKGVPILVSTGNDLIFDVFSASVNANDDIVIGCRVTGTLTRPGGSWTAKGETLTLTVPARKKEGDGDS